MNGSSPPTSILRLPPVVLPATPLPPVVPPPVVPPPVGAAAVVYRGSCHRWSSVVDRRRRVTAVVSPPVVSPPVVSPPVVSPPSCHLPSCHLPSCHRRVATSPVARTRRPFPPPRLTLASGSQSPPREPLDSAGVADRASTASPATTRTSSRSSLFPFDFVWSPTRPSCRSSRGEPPSRSIAGRGRNTTSGRPNLPLTVTSVQPIGRASRGRSVPRSGEAAAERNRGGLGGRPDASSYASARNVRSGYGARGALRSRAGRGQEDRYPDREARERQRAARLGPADPPVVLAMTPPVPVSRRRSCRGRAARRAAGGVTAGRVAARRIASGRATAVHGLARAGRARALRRLTSSRSLRRSRCRRC